MDTRETTRETHGGGHRPTGACWDGSGPSPSGAGGGSSGLVVLLAVMASYASGLTEGRLARVGRVRGGRPQSLAVQRDLEQRFANQFPTTALVTVHDEARTVDDPAFRAVVGDRRPGRAVQASAG